MRIGYLGDGAWARLALDLIDADGGFDVAFVVLRHGAPDEALRAAAESRGIDVFDVADVNGDAFLARATADACEVLVSMSFDQIFRERLIRLAPRGLINCHAGALPFYRGRNPLNWALINGETAFGVTVHHVDEGIDTGDIIVQRMVPIEPEDDYGTLLEKAPPACAEALLEALIALRDGTARRRSQSEIDPVGFYCGRRRAGDERLDWMQTSRRVHDFVRGVAPPAPGARTHAAGTEIAVTGTRLIPGAPDYVCTCGEVVGRAEDGVVVKTGDTTLVVTEIREVAADGSLGAPRRPRFRIGTRLA